MAQEKNFTFVSADYLGMNKNRLFKCNKCGFEWNVKPSRVKNGATCPNCRMYIQKIEKSISSKKN